MNFGNTSEISLSESISGYVTCVEDDEADNTHYLSVLSQDLSLEEMNVTLSNAQVNGDDETLEGNADDAGQPIFFTIDGTNEIYGVQIARDEEGNLQKYQAQYTENSEGQLVPMFDTVQVLPIEEDIQNDVQREDDDNAQMPESHGTQQIVENTPQKDAISAIYGGDLVHEVIDIKTEITEAHQITTITEGNVNLFHENSEDSIERVNNTLERNSHISALNENVSDALVHIKVEKGIPSRDQIGIANYDNVTENNVDVVEENIEHHFGQLYVQEIEKNCQEDAFESINGNNPDNQIYEIVDGITTGNENCFEESIQTILKESIEHQIKTNILKKLPQKSILKEQTGAQPNIYYVQAIPEKENMEFMDVERQLKPNSRSLLICNQPGQSVKKKNPDPQCVKDNKNAKRASRTKEAKEARQFINFINATTIPQVPERKERLPRKQQIKPVQHPNEDIVVKEMIVSSNTFIEPISNAEKKNLPVTEYVELLDSGDESNPEDQNNKKHKRPTEQPIEIEISDSEDSNISIIELDPTVSSRNDEDNENPDVQKGSKQKRGRAAINRSPADDKKDPDSSSESPPKMSRTESDVESVTSTFQVISMASDGDSIQNVLEIKSLDVESDAAIVQGCSETNKPKDCIKTKNCLPAKVDTKIPEQKSKLLANKKTVQSKDTQSKKEIEYKYECEKCRSKFINKFLLNRHNCIAKSGLAFTCNTCGKKFPNSTSLNVHSKIHFKQPSLPSANPKNQKPEVSKITQRIPTRTSTMGSKPTNVAPQASARISTNFSRTGAIPKRSLKPPVIASTPKVDSNDVVKSTPNRNAGVLRLGKQCEKCPMRFDTHAAWFDHQVLNHGLKTPDKTIGEKRKKNAIKIVAHSGVLANSEVAKNFSILRSKVRAQQE